ncbi:hypothetical protein MVEN_00124900 [Mycena venus]|uniref:Uncharacterized protein n=1 Tax=Mycena venus TaxID=2733690 RepID=A0A8H6Z4W1_9AGAR|nr:hypothetical protein MVEN_00124900 [Mycena venus]
MSRRGVARGIGESVCGRRAGVRVVRGEDTDTYQTGAMPQEHLQMTATARGQIGHYPLRCCGDFDIARNGHVFLFSIDDRDSLPTHCCSFHSSYVYLYLLSLGIPFSSFAASPRTLYPSVLPQIHPRGLSSVPRTHGTSMGWLRRASLCTFATTTGGAGDDVARAGVRVVRGEDTDTYQTGAMPQEHLQMTATARGQIGHYPLRCCGDFDIARNGHVFLFSIDDRDSLPTHCCSFHSSYVYLYLLSLGIPFSSFAASPRTLYPSVLPQIHPRGLSSVPRTHGTSMGWLRRASLCTFATTTGGAGDDVARVGAGGAVGGDEREAE